jgi:hypothetical protein
MRSLLYRLLAIALLSFCALGTAHAAGLIVSLDETRTGDEFEPGGDRFLTAPAMQNATNILLNAGFTIATAPDFLPANTNGACILYTATVNVDFTAAEIANIQSFVNAGGGLVIQRDWDGFYPAADPLLAAFGVVIDTTAVPPSTGNPVVDVTGGTHPIWNGPAGSVNNYTQVFSSQIISGATIVGRHTDQNGTGAIGFVNYGLGKVVVLTDMDAWDDFGDPITPIPGSNNAIVFENIFHYVECIPEPSTYLLAGCGMLGTLWYARRRASRNLAS